MEYRGIEFIPAANGGAGAYMGWNEKTGQFEVIPREALDSAQRFTLDSANQAKKSMDLMQSVYGTAGGEGGGFSDWTATAPKEWWNTGMPDMGLSLAQQAVGSGFWQMPQQMPQGWLALMNPHLAFNPLSVPFAPQWYQRGEENERNPGNENVRPGTPVAQNQYQEENDIVSDRNPVPAPFIPDQPGLIYKPPPTEEEEEEEEEEDDTVDPVDPEPPEPADTGLEY